MTKVIQEIDKKIYSEDTCFIPTMGSLHSGHLSLIEHAKQMSHSKTVVSIFVNRKQFNDSQDFHNYPIDIDKDIRLLEKLDVDYVFIPDESYIYPNKKIQEINSGPIGIQYDGKFREGHFDGVLTVVNRLFKLVNPSAAVFGKKDAQQLFLIKEMIKKFKMNIQIYEGKLIREKNGLAMSSRNLLLTDQAKEKASNIYKILLNTKNFYQDCKSISQSIIYGKSLYEQLDIEYDYLDVVDVSSFSAPDKNSKKLLLITAGYIENIRLIDNLEILK